MIDWKAFEMRVKRESLIQGTPIVKVPENIQFFHGKLIYRKTEFDFAASIDGVAAFFDCKCMGGSVFNFKSYVLRDKKIHQWDNLKFCHENSSIAGYLIYFYEHQTSAWAGVETVKAAMDRGDKALTLESPGLKLQPDSVPISLRALLKEDRARVITRIK